MKIFDFPFNSSSYKVDLSRGLYLFEAWGAGGCSQGGRGAYTSGYIRFKEKITIYVFVGEKGNWDLPSFNGNKGGTNCANGGGSTDFRLVNSDDWSNFLSLKTRIMTAGAGGGGDDRKGGNAGSYWIQW